MAKSENLHGVDLKDREQIFKAMLPQENFVDRRIATYEDIEEESEDDMVVEAESVEASKNDGGNSMENDSMARQYVGELINRIAQE